MQLLIGSTFLLLSSYVQITSSLSTQEPLYPHPPSQSQSQSQFQSHESSSTKALLALHQGLVTHESITGNEESVGDYLAHYLEKAKFTVEIQEVAPRSKSHPARNNIFAYLGSHHSARKTRTLISSHIDTVPPFWKYERRGDEIWGRGSVDAKGSVAAQVRAVEELIESGEIKKGDVGLLFVVGEEVNGDGMKKANDLGLEWESVIFGEPTELKLASGHKGIIGVEISAKGRAGHSGYPELGKSANAMLIPALNALLNAELPSSEKYGNTTMNIGRIEGGVAGNVIPEDAKALLAIRIADGQPEDVQKIILDTVNELGEELTVKFLGGYGPVYIDSDVPGFETMVVNYGTDIPNLKGDHKRYLYGPGTILLAHSDHEHLRISDLEAAVEGYKALIKHSLK
ncbi:related to diaminopropionate ammonia-lyase [Rhynchosporium agropyri]|uniref:Related to diaminopropionate ammonia-lyase n=1 Tax=Rhynchosporium agropyri TaxID=914238 RepID=A0A1E1K924_9HELO|nr:related to diaminopropionate ammonia-lyase [Rhynchosporium agropyri]